MTAFRGAAALGVRACDPGEVVVDAPVVHGRVKGLAKAQSADVRDRLTREGITVLNGPRAASARPSPIAARIASRSQPQLVASRTVRADVVLVATGATPRILPGSEPDG